MRVSAFLCKKVHVYLACCIGLSFTRLIENQIRVVWVSLHFQCHVSFLPLYFVLFCLFSFISYFLILRTRLNFSSRIHFLLYV